MIEKLSESYLKILDKQVLYKSKCSKYEGKDRVDIAEASINVSTNVENNNDEEMDTSSGIESGQDDSNSSVGERSPETIEVTNSDTESNNNFVESILDNRYVLKHYI